MLGYMLPSVPSDICRQNNRFIRHNLNIWGNKQGIPEWNVKAEQSNYKDEYHLDWRVKSGYRRLKIKRTENISIFLNIG